MEINFEKVENVSEAKNKKEKIKEIPFSTKAFVAGFFCLSTLVGFGIKDSFQKQAEVNKINPGEETPTSITADSSQTINPYTEKKVFVKDNVAYVLQMDRESPTVDTLQRKADGTFTIDPLVKATAHMEDGTEKELKY